MSNYTQLGFVKQTDGENTGTWGDVLNENLIDLLDDAIGGYVEVSVASGNVTLAFADGTADNNGRHAVIKFTGSPGTTRTVTFPDAQVNYFIINGSDASVICTSGSGAATVTIPTGMKNIIYVDGSDEILSMFATPNISGNVTIGVDDTGYDVKFFGATSGSYLLWDESADSLLLTDSTPLKIGDSQDLTLYHDGSNSYITNSQGALKVATETSGIAVTIGHTTSETTIADNLTTTGNTSVGGTLGVTGVATFSTHVALGDSDILKLGDAPDMQLYHDGSNSYITNATGALKIATETSGIAVTIGHTTSETTIADNATVTGNLSVGGDFDVTGSFDMSDANITNIGSIALDTITNDGTDITLDSSGDIILDAAGDTIFLKDAGTTFGSLDNTSGNLIIKSGTTTAATFSGANVTLAGTVGSGAITSTSTVQGTTITATTAFVPDASDGAALGTTALEFSDLFLADGAVINLGDDQDITLTHVADTGVTMGGSHANGTNLQITNSATDGDAVVQFALGGTVQYSMGVEDGDSDKFVINYGTGALGAQPALEISSAGAVTVPGNLTVSGTLSGAASAGFALAMAVAL